ncbi:MAG: hypothetical protein KTR16_06465 [Acidiferrobacterales bacterium]|nr:hypothetical protein [Acidiferrobacterales bacterium]
MNTNRYVRSLSTGIYLLSILVSIPSYATGKSSSKWLLVDDFENNDLSSWFKRDTKNETSPFVEAPQITEIRREESGNHYLVKKPAREGVVGNRKALSFIKLPNPIDVGETATLYTRIQVENFPNNHIFGLSNLNPKGITKHDYNAFEPSLRITDKVESDGFRNDGTLMVKLDDGYSNIRNYAREQSAKPLKEGLWYDVWYVVNNAPHTEKGQRYDVFLRGGEFTQQTLVYRNADFRMKRNLPLNYFLANCNTGPANKPYGNGGLKYDDIYMAFGIELSTPTLNLP